VLCGNISIEGFPTPALQIEDQSGRSLHTWSHTRPCRGVGHWRWGCYGGYTLPDYKEGRETITTDPRGIPEEHAQVRISRLEYPFLIRLISWRLRRDGYERPEVYN